MLGLKDFDRERFREQAAAATVAARLPPSRSYGVTGRRAKEDPPTPRLRRGKQSGLTLQGAASDPPSPRLWRGKRERWKIFSVFGRVVVKRMKSQTNEHQRSGG